MYEPYFLQDLYEQLTDPKYQLFEKMWAWMPEGLKAQLAFITLQMDEKFFAYLKTQYYINHPEEVDFEPKELPF